MDCGQQAWGINTPVWKESYCSNHLQASSHEPRVPELRKNAPFFLTANFTLSFYFWCHQPMMTTFELFPLQQHYTLYNQTVCAAWSLCFLASNGKFHWCFVSQLFPSGEENGIYRINNWEGYGWERVRIVRDAPENSSDQYLRRWQPMGWLWDYLIKETCSASILNSCQPGKSYFPMMGFWLNVSSKK